MAKEAKTNAIADAGARQSRLHGARIPPTPQGEAVDGATVAKLTGQDPARVFKTLVTQGADRNYYVFVIPVEPSSTSKRQPGLPVSKVLRCCMSRTCSR